jgi:hypothetical protein
MLRRAMRAASPEATPGDPDGSSGDARWVVAVGGGLRYNIPRSVKPCACGSRLFLDRFCLTLCGILIILYTIIPACILVSDLVFTSKEEAAREKYQADCLRFFHSIVKNILWSQDKVKEFFKEIKK